MLETVKDAVILRPSIMFGPEDGFFNSFADNGALFAGAAADRRRRDEIPAGLSSAMSPKRSPARSTASVKGGKIYELGGPKCVTFRELMEEMLEVIDRKRLLVPVPFWAAKIIGCGRSACCRARS